MNGLVPINQQAITRTHDEQDPRNHMMPQDYIEWKLLFYCSKLQATNTYPDKLGH